MKAIIYILLFILFLIIFIWIILPIVIAFLITLFVRKIDKNYYKQEDYPHKDDNQTIISEKTYTSAENTDYEELN